jgi:hypothetical protein
MENDKQLVSAEQQEHDGFDDHDEGGGFGVLEKFVDGTWTTGGVPSDPERRLIALRTETWLRRWQNKRVIDEIKTHPLPNLDDLNASIPVSEWEPDPFTGQPRKPYERTHRVDFLNLDTGSHSTFVSATSGAAKGVSLLKGDVRGMRLLRGANVVPQIELGSGPFPTKYGMKKRPDFKPVAWFDLSGGGSTAVQAQAPKALPPVAPTPVKPPSINEETGDSIPF